MTFHTATPICVIAAAVASHAPAGDQSALPVRIAGEGYVAGNSGIPGAMTTDRFEFAIIIDDLNMSPDTSGFGFRYPNAVSEFVVDDLTLQGVLYFDGAPAETNACWIGFTPAENVLRITLFHDTELSVDFLANLSNPSGIETIDDLVGLTIADFAQGSVSVNLVENLFGPGASASGTADMLSITYLPVACPSDLNADGERDFFDVNILLNDQPDLDGSTTFDFFDITSFLDGFNEPCP
jgi:hypothetical protein